mmetsp:Transcript_15608/g.24276  ORF Transcript_15608/g.24276 Transcript_15608/m.24276 type:complete len:495 (+) Transcript_15608:107-1591(+)|eukprot:CAMPEP_0196817478 /NCGR_PEP_ID=MMETSP1362-20130617/60990_1 /TAXON_ID=163516 /ORGANISM="Leptocylindrus danicus, Strain CCMP1856" /LENGTH=494 /DNA_ID=CAMNT_0042195187 /DNA_START=45 /DNA_END=1529 /DNA_ORIENTATION=+
MNNSTRKAETAYSILLHHSAHHIECPHYEETLQNLIKANPQGAIYKTNSRGQTLLHSIFMSDDAFPSADLIALACGLSFLTMIQDDRGFIPLHYACSSAAAIRNPSKLAALIELCPEAVLVQSYDGKSPLDMYMLSHQSRDVTPAPEIIALLQSKFVSPLTPDHDDVLVVSSVVKNKEESSSSSNNNKTPVSRKLPFSDITNSSGGLKEVKGKTSSVFKSPKEKNSNTENKKLDVEDFKSECIKLKAALKKRDEKNDVLAVELSTERSHILEYRSTNSYLKVTCEDLAAKLKVEQEKCKKLETALVWELDLRDDAEAFYEQQVVANNIHEEELNTLQRRNEQLQQQYAWDYDTKLAAEDYLEETKTEITLLEKLVDAKEEMVQKLEKELAAEKETLSQERKKNLILQKKLDEQRGTVEQQERKINELNIAIAHLENMLRRETAQSEIIKEALRGDDLERMQLDKSYIDANEKLQHSLVKLRAASQCRRSLFSIF